MDARFLHSHLVPLAYEYGVVRYWMKVTIAWIADVVDGFVMYLQRYAIGRHLL